MKILQFIIEFEGCSRGSSSDINKRLFLFLLKPIVAFGPENPAIDSSLPRI